MNRDELDNSSSLWCFDTLSDSPGTNFDWSTGEVTDELTDRSARRSVGFPSVSDELKNAHMQTCVTSSRDLTQNGGCTKFLEGLFLCDGVIRELVVDTLFEGD